MKEPQFPFRGVFQGFLIITCPDCGELGRYRITPNNPHWKCEHCESSWLMGIRAIKRQGGQNGIPSDMLLPIQDLEPERWKRGKGVHMVVL